MEMYYTNTNGADAGYDDSGGYFMDDSHGGDMSAEYQTAQGYGTMNQSAEGFDTRLNNYQSMSHSGAYQQPGMQDPLDFMPEQTNMSFLDRSLMSAQQSLESWKSISVRSSTGLYSSTTDESQVGSSDYAAEEELMHPGPMLSTAAQSPSAFNPHADSHLASVSTGMPPRPHVPAGIRTFQPRNSQLQRPPAPPVARPSAMRMPRPPVPVNPVHMPESSYDEDSSTSEWQTLNSYCEGNDSHYSEAATTDCDQEVYNNEQFVDEEMHYGMGHPDHFGHKVQGPAMDRRENQGFAGFVRGSNLNNLRANLAERQGPRFGRRQELEGSGFSLPAPGRFHPDQRVRPAGFGIRQPSGLRQIRPPAAVVHPRSSPNTNAMLRMRFSSQNSNRDSGSYQNERKTGFSTGGVLKSALKTPVRSLMDLTVGPPKPKGPSTSVPVNQQQQDFSEVSCRELLLCAPPPPPPPPPPATPPQDPTIPHPSPPPSDVAEETVKKESPNDNVESDDEEELDTSQCEVCNMKFDKEQVYHVHIRSTSHLQKLMERERQASVIQSPTSQAPTEERNVITPKGPNYCHVCCFDFTNAEVFNSHLLGLVHRQKLEAQKNDISSKSKVLDTVTNSRVEYQPKPKTVMSTKTDNKMITTEDFISIDDFKFGVAPFTCTVCDVQCTGERSYEMHVAGAKHLKKLKKKGEIVQFENRMENLQPDEAQSQAGRTPKRVVRIQEELDKSSEALIGLDYITEYQLDDPNTEPCYICDLCQSKMDPRQVISHVVGIRHRTKYFKFHREREYWALWNIHRKSDKVKTAEIFAIECQRQEGRHRVRLKVLLSPFADDSTATSADRNIWKEIANDKARLASDLPGCRTMAELNARYKPEKDEDDYDGEDEPQPALSAQRPFPPHARRPSPPRLGFRENPKPPVGSSYFEGPPFNHAPGYPPFHDPYRQGVRERDAYSQPGFGQRPPVYPPYYDRPPYDPTSMSRSNLDYRDRYSSHEDRYSLHLRRMGTEGDPRPAAIRPVVVDYNHGSASGDKGSASKPETSRNSSDRDYIGSQEREQRVLEEEKLRTESYDRGRRSLERDAHRPVDRNYDDEKLRSGSYDRERKSLERNVRRPADRNYDDEKLRSGNYDRERKSLERDVRRPADRNYDDEKLRSGNYDRERRSLERDARRSADRNYDDEKLRSGSYDRERKSLERDVRRPADRNFDDEKLRSGSYDRERRPLERDIRRPADQAYSEDSVDRDRLDHRLDKSVLDSNRYQTAVMGEHAERASSYERESLHCRERDRSSLDREQIRESGRQGSSSMEVDVNFVKNAIAQCNINTEADAEIALQISNSLTQALLEYRLAALHKQGKSDPDLEQHLNDLRLQNAELAEIHSGSGKMYEALAAAKRLAKTLGSGSGTQELVQMAMSVLDAVNKQLYGMLDSNVPASTDKEKDLKTSPADSQRSPDRDSHREQGRSRRSHEPDMHRNEHAADHGNNETDRFYQSDRDSLMMQSTSQNKRGTSAEREQLSPSEAQSASSRTAASSKRFRFGL